MVKISVNDSLKDVLNANNVDVKNYIPAYNGESAGLDLYNTGKNIYVMSAGNQYISRSPDLKILIPTGIRVAIPKGYVGLIQERGSITKTPLKVRAGVIDSGYTGEVFVNCINVTRNEFTISKGCKLPFQLVVVKCDNEFEVVSEEEYLSLSRDSSRKEGIVGSSD
tara:strand:+ start:171 stop:668 length:498 start_codon:yes stop_codon:yes gene_type:complete